MIKMRIRTKFFDTLLTIAIFGFSSILHAQETDEAALAKATQNPLANVQPALSK